MSGVIGEPLIVGSYDVGKVSFLIAECTGPSRDIPLWLTYKLHVFAKAITLPIREIVRTFVGVHIKRTLTNMIGRRMAGESMLALLNFYALRFLAMEYFTDCLVPKPEYPLYVPAYLGSH